MNHLRPCLVVTGALLVLCCGVYPAVVTGMANALFPRQSSGSLITEGNVVRGSALIGQTFEKPEEHPMYFWGRPSAASVDTASGNIVSSGSNLGPRNEQLVTEVQARIDALRKTGVAGDIPIDLVTKSGSGLDPHESVAAALVQIPRVAAARNMSESELRALVEKHTEGRTLGFLGEPRVNILELNLDLSHGRGL